MHKLYYGSSLYHYGIKGQKWGIRRYQNKDGSLTEAGHKRYSKMTDDQVLEDIQKQVNKQKKKMDRRYKNYHVRGSQYTYIGPESEKAAKKYLEDRDKYLSSKKHIAYIRKKGAIDNEWLSGKISDEDYRKKYDDVYNDFIKNVYDAKYDDYNRNTGTNSKKREYAKEWLDSYGKDITIGFLKDLGYNDLSAKEIEARIRKSSMKVVI